MLYAYGFWAGKVEGPGESKPQAMNPQPLNLPVSVFAHGSLKVIGLYVI